MAARYSYYQNSHRLSAGLWSREFPDREVFLSIEPGNNTIEYIVKVLPLSEFSQLRAREVCTSHPAAVRQFESFCRKAAQDEQARAAA